MRELAPTQLHLWQFAIGGSPAARELSDSLILLSDAEKTRCARFHFDRHRIEYALSHAMLRRVLSEYAPVQPAAWEFVTGDQGKPEIASPSTGDPLWFNLSHTDGLAVCVVGRVRQLGVDVENVDRPVSCLELAERSFAPAEYEYLTGIPPNLRRDAFFRIWTLKEAYIKADGRGLAIPLDSFHFRFAPEGPAIVTLESEGWSFFEFHSGADCRIAVGVAGSGPFQLERFDAASLLNPQVSGE